MVTVREYVVELRTRFNEASARAAKSTLGAIEATAEGAREATTLLGRAFRDTAKESAALAERATATKRTIDETRDATRRLGAEQKLLRNETAELRAQRTALNKDLKALRDTIKRAGKATLEQLATEKKLEAALKGVDRELEKNAKQSREVAAEKRKLGAEIDRLTADYNGLKRAAGDAAAAQDGILRRAGRGVGALAGRGARVAGRGVRAGARVAGRAGLAAATLGGSEVVRAGGGALGALGLTPQTAALAAVGTALTKSTKAAIDFESSFADVEKVLGGEGKLDDTGLQALQQDIIDLSTRDIPIAAEGISNIVAAAGQAGIGGQLLAAGDVEGAREEIVRFTESAAKVGVAFDISAGEAGTALAKLRTGLGLNQEEVEGLAGTINVLSNALPATAAEILDVEKRVGALAQSAGVSKEETAGLAAALIGAGAPSNIAATAIKNLTLSLGAGEAATKKQRAALAELGLTAEQAAKLLQEDAGALIERTFTRISEFAPEQQTGLLTELVGKESVGAIGPLLGNLESLGQAFRLAADEQAAATSVEEEFASRSKTTANQLQLLRNRVTAVGISVGNELLPQINEFLDSLDEGKFEGFGEAAVATARAIIDGVIAIRDAITPFYEGLASATSDNLPAFKAAGQDAIDAIVRLARSVSALLDQVIGKAGDSKSGLQELGELAGGAVLGAFELLSDVIGAVADGLTAVSDGIRAISSGEVTQGLRDLGNSLVAFVVDPLRAITKQVIALAEAVGAGGAVPDALRDFAGGVSAAEAVRRTVARERETRQAAENRRAGERQQRASDDRRRALAEVASLESAARARGVIPRRAAPAPAASGGGRRRAAGGGAGGRGKRTASPFEGVSSEVRAILDPEFKSERIAESRRKPGSTRDLDVLTRGVVEAQRGARIGGARNVSSGRSAGAGPTIFQTIVNIEQNNSIDARGQPAEVVPAVQRGARAFAANGQEQITGIAKAVTFLNNQAGRRTS